jgi:hypothetical protein
LNQTLLFQLHPVTLLPLPPPHFVVPNPSVNSETHRTYSSWGAHSVAHTSAISIPQVLTCGGPQALTGAQTAAQYLVWLFLSRYGVCFSP